MKRRISLVVLVGLVIVGSAFAQDDGTEFSCGEAVVVTTKASVFDSNDRDADGRISYEEFRNRMAKVFHNLDKNLDGTLSKGELDEVMVAHQGHIDLDANGRISDREFAGITTLIFAWADTDNDGYLTRSEAKKVTGGEAAQ